MGTIQKLIKTSTVPVKFTNIQERCNFYGAYFCEMRENDAHIEISRKLKKYQKEAVLVHELGHARCDKRNCHCIKKNDKVLIEIHAYMYSLKWLLKNKRKRALKCQINRLKANAKTKTIGFFYYNEAAERIIKSKLWKRCIEFL